MPKKQTATNIQKKEVPIKWNIPDNIITRFATHMAVQAIENEFKISFFEIAYPILLGSDNTFPNEAQANCVASVIVTADRLPKFIKTLQGQLDRYNALTKPNE